MFLHRVNIFDEEKIDRLRVYGFQLGNRVKYDVIGVSSPFHIQIRTIFAFSLGAYLKPEGRCHVNTGSGTALAVHSKVADERSDAFNAEMNLYSSSSGGSKKNPFRSFCL